MENKYEISGTFLRQSINEMKNIRTGAYSVAKHGKKAFLEEKAEQYFDLFAQDKLDIKPDDLKTFSQYIDTFAAGKEKENLLNTLQEKADFNVREFLYDNSRSWWKKLLSKEKYSLSAKKLNKKVLKYIKARRKLDVSGYYSGAAGRAADKLRNEAEEIIEAYNNNYFTLKPENRRAFKRYIETMGIFYEGSSAEKAMKKLKETKISNAEPIKKNSSFSLKKVKYALSGIALTAVMSVGAWFGLGNNDKKQDTPKEKQQTVSIINKLSQPKMNMPQPIDYSLDAFIKTNKVDTVPEVKISQSAGDDFYESRLNRFISKNKKEKIKSILAEQINKGIISLPENISPSRFLYAGTIYQKYGLKDIAKEFDDALKADIPLSAKAQAELYTYVDKAGAKGLGARNMAYKQHYGKHNKTQKNLAQVVKENKANLR